MSAEAIVYDRLDSEAIPVMGMDEGIDAGEEGQTEKAPKEDYDDPNVTVPEGMDRYYVDFQVDKPEKITEEEESVSLDEAIAEDGAKHPSPLKRKVATTWENCKAKNVATCPYHGAAFMRDQFNAIFKKHGFENAQARVVPLGTDDDPSTSYRMYFNLPKKYDEKALKKAFAEMEKVSGVTNLKAKNIENKYFHNEPESHVNRFEVEEFDPDIDPNEEMAEDLAKEKAEAEKKAAEEKAKKEAEEKAKKEAEEKAKAEAAEKVVKEEAEKKKAEADKIQHGLMDFKSQMKDMESRIGCQSDYPVDKYREAKYLAHLFGTGKTKGGWVPDDDLNSVKAAAEAFKTQRDSYNVLKDKAGSVKNPATKKLLDKVLMNSFRQTKIKGGVLDEAIKKIKDGVIECAQADINHANEIIEEFYKKTTTDKDSWNARISDALSELSEENLAKFNKDNYELLARRGTNIDNYLDAKTLLQNYANQAQTEMSENGRLDKAIAILDSEEYATAEYRFKEMSYKYIESSQAVLEKAREAKEAQDAAESVRGQSPSAEDISAVMAQVKPFFNKQWDNIGQKKVFEEGLAKLPAIFVKTVTKGVKYGKTKKKGSYANNYSWVLSEIGLAKKSSQYLAETLTHELGHAFAYRIGLNRQGIGGWKIPDEIVDYTKTMEEEGRAVLKQMFKGGHPTTSRTDSNFVAFRKFVKGVEGFENYESSPSTSRPVDGFSDVLGCVNRGGFYGHKMCVYKNNWSRTHEMFANGVAALAGHEPLLEKYFPKSIAKLRELIEKSNVTQVN